MLGLVKRFCTLRQKFWPVDKFLLNQTISGGLAIVCVQQK